MGRDGALSIGGRVLRAPLLWATIALATLGLINLNGLLASADQEWLFVKQLWWLGLGLVAGALAAVIDYRTVERQAYRLYAVGVALLLLVHLIGRSANGAQRWLDFGVIHLQPAELIKLLLVVAIARYCADNPGAGRLPWLRGAVIPGALTAAPMALILLQPDLSSALIVAAIGFCLVLLMGLSLRSLLSLIAMAVLACPLVWAYGLREYQRARILAITNPDHDPLGSGWQTLQSMTAIGSGGLNGTPFGQSVQHSFVPFHHADLPFSIWAEEQGLIGAALVLALYLIACLSCVRVSRTARDRFGEALAAGVAVMLFWQVFVNIGVAAGILPPTGVALPFFSSGGSAVFTTLLGFGLVMGVGLRRGDDPRRSSLPGEFECARRPADEL